jgi:anti-anti-sigma regulatory factor
VDLFRQPATAVPSPDPPEFRLLIDIASGRISVQGDLDRPHVPQLVDAVDLLRCSPSPRWSIDAAGITFCDAGGLRGLLHANEMAVRYGVTVEVTRPSRMLARLLAILEPGALTVVPVDQ